MEKPSQKTYPLFCNIIKKLTVFKTKIGVKESSSKRNDQDTKNRLRGKKTLDMMDKKPENMIKDDAFTM